ncbi:MAG: antitoxin MazE family protein [Roseomonas sp.]|nr:antitoxin MazE family protein [Roseomonas sp.]
MGRSSRASRLAAHHAQLRALGLRPIEIWVPDTRAPGFAKEARRQSLLVAAECAFDDMMDFIERNAPQPDDHQGGN